MLKVMQEKLLRNKALISFTTILGFLTLYMPAFSQAPDEDYMNGFACFKKGDYITAIESISSAILRNNADEQLYLTRGESLLILNEIDRALSDFKEANIILPGIADFSLARAYAMS